MEPWEDELLWDDDFSDEEEDTEEQIEEADLEMDEDSFADWEDSSDTAPEDERFKDWAFTLTTSILYYNDYDLIDEDTRNLYRKGMAAFGGIAPSYHIELLDKPTIYWDFHSLLLGIQMMFSFLLVDGEKPLRLCKHCQKVFLSSRSNSAFCSPRCKNQYNVYKSRGKKSSEED